MEWERFVEAATASSWVTYLGTANTAGEPHVSVVAPGFTSGSLWFATRQSSKKFRNLTANTNVFFHWPVGNTSAPGELTARGHARVYTSGEDRRRLWEARVLPYDMAASFGSAENEDLAFVEVSIVEARLLCPDFVAGRWRRSDRMG